MTDPIRIALSKTSVLRFAERQRAIDELVSKLDELQRGKSADASALLAQQCEPEQFAIILSQKWSLAVSESEVVCSPPPDIAPAVEDAAA